MRYLPLPDDFPVVFYTWERGRLIPIKSAGPVSLQRKEIDEPRE